MCGIVGYVGNDNTAEVLLESLSRLEYRGYDSAGVALVCNGSLQVIRSYGRIFNLRQKMPHGIMATMGIGHTRWATHGKPSEANAHPHRDCTGRIAVVHNGIIENYKELKDMLLARGHTFTSETDTEVVSHLLEDNYTGDMQRALLETVRQLKGSFALAIVNQDEPGKIYAARKDSPMVIGIGEGQYFLASDVTAFLKHTRKALFLEDGDVAILSHEGVRLMDFEGREVFRSIKAIEWDLEAAEKAGYDHFMLKEIHEQPTSLKAAIAGRLDELKGNVNIKEITLTEEQIRNIRHIVIIACGTSYHAGMMGRYVIEELTDLPVSIEIGSEFRYSHFPLDESTLVIAISQSGETADTLAAVKDAMRNGSHVIGITNVVGSTLSREANDIIYMLSGPEIGVAATKTFTAQVVVMYMIAIMLARARGSISIGKASKLIRAIKTLPQKSQLVLDMEAKIAETASLFSKSGCFFLVGRHLNFPVALEGALKIKEISYVMSEGFAAGELKHGPLALLTTGVPVIAIATESELYDKMVSNIREIKARDATVIAVASESNRSVEQVADLAIRVPDSCEYISPILSSIVLQLFAYYVALARGCPIDKPRNLAKSVTVE
ncbi:glucosamine--fructose-6-phosphate aminotransferase [isomerizing] [Methanocella paludicola SANAE]|uniref:Glutamine--fructose-6-phosphate aminotransferase [isomerizing] n=1 Tax=Methanocella paludicola (strain DSM 17711 / JCM 13418 / NBRC 101707 / SANAE) TaxID=304371 RepID=D1YWQ4_METPS|nr:glutamine--fructose-6-phosphate transaminase (isomerizing) [Methanocella paludicola]BAI60876.1 glucosamine--fructose-6-phosphate aminotransferase [isomerizing] [Methanocella paludicola SANAE]